MPDLAVTARRRETVRPSSAGKSSRRSQPKEQRTCSSGRTEPFIYRNRFSCSNNAGWKYRQIDRQVIRWIDRQVDRQVYRQVTRPVYRIYRFR
jgi:hypothetical protein